MNAKKQDPPVKKNAFVHKLYTMLNDPKLAHLIWWTNHNHENNTFALYPGKEFANALTGYFKHGNVASFVRQLHMYGFHKVSDPSNDSNDDSSDKESAPIWEFKHLSGKFKKDDEGLLMYIKRRSSSNSLRNSYSGEQHPPGFGQIMGQQVYYQQYVPYYNPAQPGYQYPYPYGYDPQAHGPHGPHGPGQLVPGPHGQGPHGPPHIIPHIDGQSLSLQSLQSIQVLPDSLTPGSHSSSTSGSRNTSLHGSTPGSHNPSIHSAPVSHNPSIHSAPGSHNPSIHSAPGSNSSSISHNPIQILPMHQGPTSHPSGHNPGIQQASFPQHRVNNINQNHGHLPPFQGHNMQIPNLQNPGEEKNAPYPKNPSSRSHTPLSQQQQHPQHPQHPQPGPHFGQQYIASYPTIPSGPPSGSQNSPNPNSHNQNNHPSSYTPQFRKIWDNNHQETNPRERNPSLLYDPLVKNEAKEGFKLPPPSSLSGASHKPSVVPINTSLSERLRPSLLELHYGKANSSLSKPNDSIGLQSSHNSIFSAKSSLSLISSFKRTLSFGSISHVKGGALISLSPHDLPSEIQSLSDSPKRIKLDHAPGIPSLRSLTSSPLSKLGDDKRNKVSVGSLLEDTPKNVSKISSIINELSEHH